MYSQFFGHFLLSHDNIDKDTILEILQNDFHPGLTPPFKSVYYGYLTDEEYFAVEKEAKETGKRFYDLVVDHGYMDEGQLAEFTREKEPTYLMFAQHLVDSRSISPSEMTQIVADYVSNFELVDLEMMEELNSNVDELMQQALMLTDGDVNIQNILLDYSPLLFNNLIQYVGEDLTPLSVQPFEGYATKICAKQEMNGDFHLVTAIDMDESTAIEFAKRFSQLDITEYNEYVDASLCDFMNQLNGLYNVNISNERGLHLDLDIPESVNYDILSDSGVGYLITISFSFGFVMVYLLPL